MSPFSFLLNPETGVFMVSLGAFFVLMVVLIERVYLSKNISADDL